MDSIMSLGWLVHWLIFRYVSMVLTKCDPPYCNAIVSPWSWYISVKILTASESKSTLGLEITPNAYSWCPSAHFDMRNCAALVRSRQSIQFVRKTPCWRENSQLKWMFNNKITNKCTPLLFGGFYATMKETRRLHGFLCHLFKIANHILVGTLGCSRHVPRNVFDLLFLW